MIVRGLNGQVEVTGTHVVIRRQGFLATLSKGFAGEKSIPLQAITSVQFKPGGLMLNGFIKLVYPGSTEIRGNLNEATQDANAVIFTRKANGDFEALKKRIEAAASPTNSPPKASVADDLERLADLRDKGVLTEAEFADKKKELLARM